MALQIDVTIRDATLADVPAMAEVIAAGFFDDDLFGDFIHPRRKEFPADYNYSWQKEIWNHLTMASSRDYVCVENATGRVIAICLVNRLGHGASSKPVHAPESEAQQAGVLTPHPWEERGWTDRSADPVARAKFDKNWDDITHHFSGSRKECWLIDFFCVHPDFQRKGLGPLLLQQAVELGKNENPKVPVGVISSAVGDSFYTKFGFTHVAQANVGDLSHIKGGSIKFYEHHLMQS